MSDPRWFKLLVRGIGLILIGQAFPQIVTAVTNGVAWYQQGASYRGDRYWIYAVAYLTGGLLQGLFGVYLLMGAPRLVRYCIGQVGFRCAACDYDLRGIKGQCPECGLKIADGAGLEPRTP